MVFVDQHKENQGPHVQWTQGLYEGSFLGFKELNYIPNFRHILSSESDDCDWGYHLEMWANSGKSSESYQHTSVAEL